MMRAVFKNAAFYSAGLIAGKFFSVAVFVLLAREMGTTDFGKFAFLLTLIQVVSYFADFGLGQSYMVKKNEEEPRAFSDMVVARGATLVISFFIAYLLAYAARFSPNATVAFLLTIIPEGFLTITEYYYLRAQNTIRIMLRLICRVSVILFVLLLTNENLSFEQLAWYNLAGTTLTAFFFVPWGKFGRLTKRSLYVTIHTLKEAASYATLSVVSYAYSRGDSLLIGYLLNSNSLGLYSVAYRYLESVSILPASINKVLFPHVAVNAKLPWHKVRLLLIIMCAMGLLFGVSIFLLSEFLIVILVGHEYRSVVPILQIFSGIVVLFFLNQPLAALVQSTPSVKKFLPWGIANTVLNIGLNIVLLPRYGITAAAWIMLLTEFTGLVINWIFVKKIYG